MRKSFIALLMAMLFVWSPLRGFGVDSERDISKPNIVVILADDMGYGDLSLHGSKDVKTPHLDEMAKSGVRCRRGYVVSSVCSPSRAGLMTGRDPRRFGYQANLNKKPNGYPTDPRFQGLPVGEHTLADQLRQAGYTTALIGKWHLGEAEAFHPNRRGYDYFFGMLNGSHNYFPNPKNSRIERNGESVQEFDGQYLTDAFTDEAISWIKRQAETESPWFAFLSYNAPHTPMQAKPSDLELYSHIANRKRRTYAAMMHSLDQNVGRIRSCLQRLGQLENTLIVFFSDNGGATNNASWNGSLSGAKGSLREGGIRVPMFFNWPGKLPSMEYDVPVSSVDLLPTFLAAAGAAALPLTRPAAYEDGRNRKRAVKRFGNYDGVNLLSIFDGQKTMPERALYFRLQGQAAVIVGNDKLVRLSHRPAQLFDVATDPGEQRDLSSDQPERLAELYAMLGEWESAMTTAPLWSSSPYWDGDSSRIYDNFGVRLESELSK